MPVSQIVLDFQGSKYSANYSLSAGMITVDSSYGTKKTQLGGSEPDTLARLLFREILTAARDRGELK